MQISKRVIQLAKERALFGFSALAHHMVQDAENSMVTSVSDARSGLDSKTLSAARQFLRQDGAAFRKRVEAVFCGYLDRAMQTMYTDLRISLQDLSVGELSLIDDETVNRQIEVDRLVLRLREADDENLRRLNIIIAQLHGDHDVRERENPFRPYLMARAMYEVLHDMASDEGLAKALFGLFSHALARHLPEYYAAIREVFESSGFRAQLLARPSRMVRHQRYVGGTAIGTEINPHVLPGLQRVLELLHSPGTGFGEVNGAALSARVNASAEFQDFVWDIFNRSRATEVSPDAQFQDTLPPGEAPAERTGSVLEPASAALVSELNQYQQQAARGEAVNAEISADQNQLFAVREQLDAGKTTKLERVAIDVVAMLFEFILEDEQIPVGLRGVIGRLQIPFLKAAMLLPELLQQSEHPARQLLNRMSTAAVGLDPATPIGRNIEAEITRIVKKILAQFDDDLAIFADCLQELELFLTQHLRNADTEIALSVEAMEEAEQISVLVINTTIALRDAVTPLKLDKRIFDFIMHIWVRVLVHARWREMQEDDGLGNGQPSAMSLQYREVLSELVWSVQEKSGPKERNALIRLLPNLVKRLRMGLQAIQLPEEECRQALDQLVAVHTQVLRANQNENAPAQPSLEDLGRLFRDSMRAQSGCAHKPAESPPHQTAVIEAALAQRGVTVSLELERDAVPLFETDADWLVRMELGVCVERWSGAAYQMARLSWINMRHSLFMFKLEQDAKPIVYSSASLIKALREGSVRLVEYAPVFDRAVESLLLGAETIAGLNG